jgi:hypothetical protein
MAAVGCLAGSKAADSNEHHPPYDPRKHRLGQCGSLLFAHPTLPVIGAIMGV